MGEMVKPKGFVLFGNYEEQFDFFSDEDLGKLIRALMRHFNDNVEPHFSGMLALAYSFICSQIDRDIAEYNDTLNKRKAGGAAGGRPKKEPERGDSVEPENLMDNEKPQGFQKTLTYSENPKEKKGKERKGKEEKESGKKGNVSADAECEQAAAAFESEISQEENDQLFTEVVKSFTSCGVFLAGSSLEELKGYQDFGMEPEVLAEAAKRAADAGKATWKYTRGILQSWAKSNVLTLEDVRREDASYSRKKAAAVAAKGKQGKPLDS